MKFKYNFIKKVSLTYVLAEENIKDYMPLPEKNIPQSNNLLILETLNILLLNNYL